jgi:hypothetical protein
MASNCKGIPLFWTAAYLVLSSSSCALETDDAITMHEVESDSEALVADNAPFWMPAAGSEVTTRRASPEDICAAPTTMLEPYA